jgi:hypothetical protein
MDHYHILQVDVTATEAQIRSAYRRMARVSHPDGTDRTADPREWGTPQRWSRDASGACLSVGSLDDESLRASLLAAGVYAHARRVCTLFARSVEFRV